MKGGIDFLIRSSKQIELQLNFNPPPPLVCPGDEEETWRQEAGEEEWLLFCLFSVFPDSLLPPARYIPLPFHPDPTPLRHSAHGVCDESTSQVYFIAWSACKESSISLLWSHLKRWRGFRPHLLLIRLSFYLFLLLLLCSFIFFCGQGRICELIISGSIAGFNSAPSRRDQ